MKQLILKSIKYLFISSLILISTNSCDEVDSDIPDVPVSVNLNLDIFNELTIPGNSILLEGVGFGGVIVYCEVEGSYYAFDAACTHELSPTCVVENEGLVGTCSCCESQFVFVGGYPSKGPAAAPLKQYKTSLAGNMLRVYN